MNKKGSERTCSEPFFVNDLPYVLCKYYPIKLLMIKNDFPYEYRHDKDGIKNDLQYNDRLDFFILISPKTSKYGIKKHF